MSELIELKDIKVGMIGLSGGDTLIQKGIRFFTGSIFSHSFVVIDGPNNIKSVLETTSTLVSVSPLDRKVNEPDWVQIWEPIAPDEYKKYAISETYKKFVGKRYGYESYFWFIYRWIVRKFGYEPTKMWRSFSKGVTCTELSCNYLFKIGSYFPELFKNDLNTYAPQELYEIMNNNQDFFRLKGWLKLPSLKRGVI